jgi:molecular chaperone DnaK
MAETNSKPGAGAGAGADNIIVGIDLGTTNSLVAIVRDGKPEILKSREGRNLIPSVVSLTCPDPIIGYAAKHLKVRNAGQTVFSVKRLLGRGLDDLKEASGNLPYKLIPASEKDGIVRIQVGDRIFSPIEISAMILKELKLSAEKALGQKVTRAVVTVPAYFNDSQRQATRTAGRLAGLDVLRIINEPTAASLAYGLAQKREGLIAVYDLGGGTFDVSILRLHDGIFEVLATNGNTALGGDDLDQALVKVCAAEIGKIWKIDPYGNTELLARLLEAAEAAKIELSEKPEARMEIEFQGKKYSRLWSSSEFETLIRPILEQTREPCLAALKDAGLSLHDISDVVMVGGPTRLKAVQQTAESIFGRKPNTSVHPDEVVASGAAIQADILAGNNRDFLLLDVVPLSLGIETYGGVMSTFIPRNTRIPAVAREQFTTFVDNQTAVDVHVLQGEREKVDGNRSLARFKLRGIQPMPAGFPRIEVTFLIDADGILQVAARDLKTGNEQSIEVRPSFGLAEAEVDQMLRAKEQNAGDDEAYRHLVEAKNAADPVLRATEKRLPDARRLLSASDLGKIETHLEDLRAAVSGGDPQKIKQSTFILEQSTRQLADLIVKDALCRK